MKDGRTQTFSFARKKLLLPVHFYPFPVESISHWRFCNKGYSIVMASMLKLWFMNLAYTNLSLKQIIKHN